PSSPPMSCWTESASASPPRAPPDADQAMPAEAPLRRVTNPIRRTAARSDGSPGEADKKVWIWAAAYVLVTTLCFSPTLTLPSSPARAGAIATRDFVAPRDLIVTDPAATARRRAEAAAGVLSVYDWDRRSGEGRAEAGADQFRASAE